MACLFLYFCYLGAGASGTGVGRGDWRRTWSDRPPRPSPAFRRLALHRRWEIRFKSAKPTEFSFTILRSFVLSFCSLFLSACCSSVGVTSKITPTSPSLITPYMMCAFPYFPLPVLIMFTSVFLASSVVISCIMTAPSALYLDAFAFLSVFFSERGARCFPGRSGAGAGRAPFGVLSGAPAR